MHSKLVINKNVFNKTTKPSFWCARTGLLSFYDFPSYDLR